jgi:hypothetical protein
MAKTYDTISTFTSGQVLTAAQMNQIGTNSNNYRVPPIAILNKTASQSIANNTGVLVSWDAEDTDTDAMWSSGSQITCSTAGVYMVNAAVTWQSATLGIRRMNIQKNNGGSYDTADVVWEVNNDATPISIFTQTLTAAIKLAANDVISIGVLHNQGSPISINTNANAYQTWVSVIWQGQAS